MSPKSGLGMRHFWTPPATPERRRRSSPRARRWNQIRLESPSAAGLRSDLSPWDKDASPHPGEPGTRSRPTCRLPNRRRPPRACAPHSRRCSPPLTVAAVPRRKRRSPAGHDLRGPGMAALRTHRARVREAPPPWRRGYAQFTLNRAEPPGLPRTLPRALRDPWPWDRSPRPRATPLRGRLQPPPPSHSPTPRGSRHPADIWGLFSPLAASLPPSVPQRKPLPCTQLTTPGALGITTLPSSKASTILDPRARSQ